MSTKIRLGLTITLLSLFTYTSQGMASSLAIAMQKKDTGNGPRCVSQASRRGQAAPAASSRASLDTPCPNPEDPGFEGRDRELKQLLALISLSTCGDLRSCEGIALGFDTEGVDLRDEIHLDVLPETASVEPLPLARSSVLSWKLKDGEPLLGFDKDAGTTLPSAFGDGKRLFPFSNAETLADRPKRWSWDMMFNLVLVFMLIERYRAWMA